MFTSISWQQYLLTISSLTSVYYGAVLFLYYRSELAHFFNRKSEDFFETGNESFLTRTILGEVRPDQNVSSISNEELLFSSEEETN